MVRLAKYELARRNIQRVRYELQEGDSLGSLIENYGPDCYIDIEYGYYDDPRTYFIKRESPETDEEYNARIENLKLIKLEEEHKKKEAKRKREEDDRAVYERLKKKFEKNNGK